MDKFVIKTPRVREEKISVAAPKPKQKQAKLETLSRVVIVERIHKLKDQLKDPNISPKAIVSIFKELEKSIPSKEVLLETKIGHVVNKLRSHKDMEVKSQARVLLKKWKNFYREINARQAIHVRSDLKTETFRAKARTLLSRALDIKTDNRLVDDIEKAVYSVEKSVNNMRYRKQIRTICMKVKNDNQLKQDVLNGKIKPGSLSTMFANVFT